MKTIYCFRLDAQLDMKIQLSNIKPNSSEEFFLQSKCTSRIKLFMDNFSVLNNSCYKSQ